VRVGELVGEGCVEALEPFIEIGSGEIQRIGDGGCAIVLVVTGAVCTALKRGSAIDDPVGNQCVALGGIVGEAINDAGLSKVSALFAVAIGAGGKAE
jgi:hypothetical protein